MTPKIVIFFPFFATVWHFYLIQRLSCSFAKKKTHFISFLGTRSGSFLVFCLLVCLFVCFGGGGLWLLLVAVFTQKLTMWRVFFFRQQWNWRQTPRVAICGPKWFVYSFLSGEIGLHKCWFLLIVWIALKKQSIVFWSKDKKCARLFFFFFLQM